MNGSISVRPETTIMRSLFSASAMAENHTSPNFMRWNFVGYLYKSNYKSVNGEIYRLFVEV